MFSLGILPTIRAMPLRLDSPPMLRDNAYVALFLASDESRYMSGQTIASVDGGNFARTSIVLPSDLGGGDSVMPEELREAVESAG